MFRLRASTLRLKLPILASAAVASLSDSSTAGKLSIYPSPESEILLVHDPSTLEKQIGVARRTTTKAYDDTYRCVHGYISKWIDVEHKVENRVKSLIPPNESLTPGILYVGIATLSGSVLARATKRQRLLTRLLLPPSLLLVSFNYFLPHTASNINGYLSTLNHTYFPQFAEKLDIGKAHTGMAIERTAEWGRESKVTVQKGVENIVEKVQGLTGLKVKQGLGWGRREVEGEIAKVAGKTKDAKVEEGKRLV